MKTARNTLIAIAALLVLGLLTAGPAAAKDRNHDRIPDRWEKRHHLSLRVNQAKRDQDRDQLDNRGEFVSGSDPRDDDSDDDGVDDGDENAGVISSFDGTTLTIDLLNGGSISARVDPSTEIQCGDETDGDATDPDSGDDADEPGEDTSAGAARGSSDDDPAGSDDDPADEEGDDDSSDDESEGNCTVDDLTVGTAVHEASIEVAGGDAVFEEIELAK